MRNIKSALRLGAVGCLLLLLAAQADAADARRGEQALRASFYQNTVPTLLEVVGQMKGEVIETLALDAETAAIVTKALDETWTEDRIYAESAAALEEVLPAADLEAAMAKMTPDVQVMIKSAISEGASMEQTQKWLMQARRHKDAKEREVLARRIAAHMPASEALGRLFRLIVDVMADVAIAAAGSNEGVDEFRAELMSSLTPMLDAMNQKDAMMLATIIVYRDQPTADLRKLADALDSKPARKLHDAALRSILAGSNKAKQALVARIENDLKKAKRQ
ncbi:MAG: hypothetical protein H6729_03775 [Deltaproteobacteria bacterium]|nr:hypothetical protein [Deltaproteobacteria bacterium]